MKNLLFIFTDEQRADTINHPQLDMPHINKLAAESTLFERAYCTQPLCTPSRSSILCGLYPHTTGCTGNNIPLRAHTPSLVEMVKDDHLTGYYGKWHLGDEIFRQHGFDKWVSIEDNYISYYSKTRDRGARSDYHHFLIENGFEPDHPDGYFTRGFACRLPEEFTKPVFLAQEASKFIHDHKEQPFILYVNFLEPHMPFYGPRDAIYDPHSIMMPDNFNYPPNADQHPRAHYCHHRYYGNGFEGNDLTIEAGWRRIAANYWGLNNLIDSCTGSILETLENEGLADDTIVVFTSDHGDQMGSHRLLAKNQLFEESIRVPLMIRVPGQKARAVSNPIGQIDLVPTLLDLMDQPIPDHVQGVSRRSTIEMGQEPQDDVFVELTGIVNDEAKAGQDYALQQLEGQFDDVHAALQEDLRVLLTPDGWKFSYSPNGYHELYNLHDDPGELNNLATREPERIVALTERLRAWQAATNDVC